LQMEKDDKGSTLIRIGVSGESSFWYRPTRVVPDQRPLNGRLWQRYSNQLTSVTDISPSLEAKDQQASTIPAVSAPSCRTRSTSGTTRTACRRPYQTMSESFFWVPHKQALSCVHGGPLGNWMSEKMPPRSCPISSVKGFLRFPRHPSSKWRKTQKKLQ